MAAKVRAMGRTKTKNKGLPKYVDIHHGAYRYRGPATGWKPLTLGRDFGDAMQAYGALFRESNIRTWGDVCDRYEQTVIPGKAARTQKDDRANLVKIRKVFGRMTPSRIEPVHCYAFRDTIAQKSGAVQSNLCLALLKHMFTKAIEWGACKTNPARDVRKIPVPSRVRVPDAEEFNLVRSLAPESVQVAMDLALLTGMSRGDILSLTRAQCKDDGIHYTRAKTIRKAPRPIIVMWTDELRDVITRAKQLKPQVRQHIVARRDGKPYTADGFSTLWQRVMAEAMAKGLEQRFHFHDIRAMSATETEDLIEASERLGHSSPAVTQRIYRRKPLRVKPLR